MGGGGWGCGGVRVGNIRSRANTLYINADNSVMQLAFEMRGENEGGKCNKEANRFRSVIVTKNQTGL